MKYIFIINKIAGKESYKTVVPNIEKVCKEKRLEHEIEYSTSEKSCSDIVYSHKDEENIIIYVVGGDGTIQKTLPGIVGTNLRLGIIPSGSGNDTYRTVKSLPKGETKIDLGKINNEYFINVACTGLDAEVANNVDVLRKTIIPKKHIYNTSVIYTFFSYKFKKVKIKTDIKEIESKYTILSICNGGYYGGGFHIAPKSELTDGLLDIYYVEKMLKIAMIPLILKLKKGKHVGKRKIHKFRTNHVEIEFEQDVTFNIDGEKLTDSKFSIDILPHAITIYNDDEFVQSILSGKVLNNSTYEEKDKVENYI